MALTVLMYHEIAEPEALGRISRKINSTYVVLKDVFDAHLHAIRESGATVVTADQVYQWMAGGRELPDPAVMITFDDGFAGNHEHAMPTLLSHGMTATFFVVTNRVGDEFMLSWQQLTDMLAHGMTVGSHTASHPLLSTLDEAETILEFSRSAEVLAENLGTRPQHLSLPNGDTNPWYRQAAEAAGYLTVSGSDFGRNSPTGDLMFLKRVAIKSSTSPRDIEAYINGRGRAYRKQRTRQVLKRALVKVLSKKRYDAIYNLVAGVDEQRKGDAL